MAERCVCGGTSFRLGEPVAESAHVRVECVHCGAVRRMSQEELVRDWGPSASGIPKPQISR